MREFGDEGPGPAQIQQVYDRLGIATANERANYGVVESKQSDDTFDVVISSTSDPFDD